MLDEFKKMVKDISTGKDGVTYDCIRIYGSFAVIAYLGLCIADFVIAHTFNYISFGTGFAAIVAGQGAGLMAKQGTEPDKDDKNV